MTENKEVQDGISRRTVAKGIAWAVPAVTIASAAPAFAVSGEAPVISHGNACKAPGKSCKPQLGYSVPATISNPDTKGQEVWITDVDININTSGLNLAENLSPALPWKIPAGGSIDVFFNAVSGNSANLTFDLGFLVTWGHKADGSDKEHAPLQMTLSVPATPPDCCKA